MAYIIVLLLIGLPMMTLELTLGQKFQGGDVDAFGSINPRFRYYLGWEVRVHQPSLQVLSGLGGSGPSTLTSGTIWVERLQV